MSRFTLYAGMAFVTAFVGVSWAARGFPMHSSHPINVSQLSRLPSTVTATFGDDTNEKRHQAAIQEQLQSPDNAKRNELRIATLQAATAYALSRCEPRFKVELIKTLSAYTQAHLDVRGCKLFNCSDKKYETAAAAFDSPLDKRVQEALKQAFDQGGITTDELPSSLRMDAVDFAQGRGTAASKCTARTPNNPRP